jgi:tRNA threonylcarbamoyladenosine biosynthesis protein TsaB
MILCIDTALEHCGVGLLRDGRMVHAIDSDTYMRASEVLHQMIADVLEQSGVSLADIKAVAVNGGPGSYTGLRIGASSAKGFCYALDIPLIHAGALELMTEGAIHRAGYGDYELYIPMIDARRNEVFTAVYNKNRDVLLRPQPLILDETSFRDIPPGRALFFGNGAAKARELIRTGMDAEFVDFQCRTVDFSRLVWDKWKHSKFEDAVHYTPSYLKKFHFVSPKQTSTQRPPL